MSADALASCWGHFDLTPAQRVVMIAVADVVNDAHGNQFWMRPEVLAEKVGMDAGNVRRKMSELVAAGVLEVVEQGGGRGRSTVYRWVLTNPRQNYAVRKTASGQAETASEPAGNRVNPSEHTSYRTQETQQLTNADSESCEQCHGTNWYVPETDDRHQPAVKCDHRIGAAAGGRPIKETV